jgi:hypothetical protein
MKIRATERVVRGTELNDWRACLSLEVIIFIIEITIRAKSVRRFAAGRMGRGFAGLAREPMLSGHGKYA